MNLITRRIPKHWRLWNHQVNAAIASGPYPPYGSTEQLVGPPTWMRPAPRRPIIRARQQEVWQPSGIPSKRSLSPRSCSGRPHGHAREIRRTARAQRRRKQPCSARRGAGSRLTRLQCPRLPCSRAFPQRRRRRFAPGTGAPAPCLPREDEEGRHFSPSPGPGARTRPASPTASSTTSRVCALCGMMPASYWDILIWKLIG